MHKKDGPREGPPGALFCARVETVAASATSFSAYCAGAVVVVLVPVVVVAGAVVVIEPPAGSVVVAGAVVVVVVAAGVSAFLSEQADRTRRAEAQIAKESFFISDVPSVRVSRP